ncbi:MAG: serine/threonine-protein kinase [Candidatus Solibacter sp.]
MRIQPISSDALQTPKPLASKLPPQILDRATDGLCWVSLISAVSTVVLTLINHFFQPEVAEAWSRPFLRLVMLGVFFLSVGFIVVQRQGWLSKPRLLDAGMVFQILVAFACGLFEGAAYRNPNAVVIGHSRIAVWMILCGTLMPNAPLKSAVTGILCALTWPLAYWVDLQVFGYQAMPLSRMVVWVLPLLIVASWMYALNNHTLSYFVQQQRAEDVGSYLLESMLGRGGMGEVWRARHKTLAREAAVKLIRPEMLSSSTGRQALLLRRRFEREAQVTASLRSPHTVALYDYGQAKDGAFYYVMELLEGVDLQSMVERFGPMDPARVAHILWQVAQSLEEAHQAGLVHRDIKPRNILLAKMGLEFDYAKVLDFGLVKSLRDDDPERTLSTMDGSTTGTPAYLSPESALGREVDARSDLYSLGCTAYFLMTGKMVFEERSPTSFAIAHVQKKPQPMAERSELPVPAALEAIVMQLLEKDPADRIASARELARRLRALPIFSNWTPERAEGWWETNLPDLSFRMPVQETASTQGTVGLARA